MKRRFFVLILLLMPAGLVLYSCDEDCSSADEEFCLYVSSQNFEATGPLIDDYLATLGNNNEENLNKLSEWLVNMTCVDSATILCNSCIETYPPQSEIRVVFITNNQKISMIMDILMSNPMKFMAYHKE